MAQNSPETFALEVVRKLRENDFAAFFAGGCVRDQLLGRPAKDYDVATAAKPEEVRKVFGRRRTLPIGASFGVITVLGPKPIQVEVATFRSDGDYSDGRHPDGVTFSSAQEDAERRDFTINGMFFDPIDNQVIDYVGGRADLQAGIIRAIGEPTARIGEDRLRMLRAVRFAASYGFQIEPVTMAAIQSQAEHLSVVSQERITAELMRMLSHSNRSRALELLHETSLLPYVITPFANGMKRETWNRLLQFLASEHIQSDVVALAAILSKEGFALRPQDVRAVGEGLKLSNEQRRSLCWICEHFSVLCRAESLRRSELQPLLVQPPATLALMLMRAIDQVDCSLGEAIAICHDFLSQSPEVRDPPPLVRGEDLMQMGMKPGPAFARILSAVRAAQLDGQIATRVEARELASQMARSDA